MAFEWARKARNTDSAWLRVLFQIDVDRMFSNIVDIFAVNRSFWATCLFPMLRESRIQRCPLNPLRLREGFIRFEERFEPYVKYCLEQQTCLAYVKENRHESVLFKSYVAVSSCLFTLDWTGLDSKNLRLMANIEKTTTTA